MRTPPWADMDELRKAGVDVAEMFELRRRLAEAELTSDVRAIRRFAIAAACCLPILLIGTPVFVQSALLRLEASLALETGWLSLLVGAAATVLGALVLALSVRRLRYEFSGLRQSIAELREDAAWIREWLNERAEGETR